MRLDEYIVGRLPFKQKQYTKWDLTVNGCGVRISGATKSCVIAVWIGDRAKFETIGRISPDTPYEYLRELAIKRIGEIKRERLPRSPLRLLCDEDAQTLRQALAGYITAHPELCERSRSAIIKDFSGAASNAQMDQPAALLTTEEILRLNQEHLGALTVKDPTGEAPRWILGVARHIESAARSHRLVCRPKRPTESMARSSGLADQEGAPA